MKDGEIIVEYCAVNPQGKGLSSWFRDRQKAENVSMYWMKMYGEASIIERTSTHRLVQVVKREDGEQLRID